MKNKKLPFIVGLATATAGAFAGAMVAVEPVSATPDNQEPVEEQPVQTKKAIDSLVVNNIMNKQYTGEAITPPVYILDGEKQLELDTDYTLAYSKNINVGIADVLITGKGQYEGTKTVHFNIVKRINSWLEQPDVSNFYPGEPKYGTVRVLVKETGADDSTYIELLVDEYGAYPDDDDVDALMAYFYAGNSVTFKVIVDEADTYTGLEESYTITLPHNAYSPALSPMTYTGEPLTPEVGVFDSDTDERLVLGTDYTVEYSNNINVGTGTVTITFIGDYSEVETIIRTFEIIEPVITHSVSVEPVGTQYYAGYSICPEPIIYDTDSGEQLVNDVDFYVVYDENQEVGTGGFTIYFIGEYDGLEPIAQTFEIESATIVQTNWIKEPGLYYNYDGQSGGWYEINAESDSGANLIIEYKPAGSPDSEFTQDFDFQFGDYVVRFTSPSIVTSDGINNERYTEISDCVNLSYSMYGWRYSSPADVTKVNVVVVANATEAGEYLAELNVVDIGDSFTLTATGSNAVFDHWGIVNPEGNNGTNDYNKNTTVTPTEDIYCIAIYFAGEEVEYNGYSIKGRDAHVSLGTTGVELTPMDSNSFVYWLYFGNNIGENQTLIIPYADISGDMTIMASDGFILETGIVFSTDYETYYNDAIDNQGMTEQEAIEATQSYIVGRYGTSGTELSNYLNIPSNYVDVYYVCEFDWDNMFVSVKGYGKPPLSNN